MKTTLVQVNGTLANSIHHLPGLVMAEVFLNQAAAPPRIGQVVKTDAVNTLVLDKLKNSWYFLVIMLGDSLP